MNRWLPSAVIVMMIAGTARVVAEDQFPAIYNLSRINAATGLVIHGIDREDLSGGSLSFAGDVNRDGVDDIIIGARAADPNGPHTGASYILFGSAASEDARVFQLEDLNGENGFVCNGALVGDQSGNIVRGIGDINGDGADDLGIAATWSVPSQFATGEAYIVFGGESAGASGAVQLAELDGRDGFRCRGPHARDEFARAIAGLGDINGDGVDDLAISSRVALPFGTAAGKTYVIFGAPEIGASGTLDLSELDGSNGFVCYGVDLRDGSGNSIAAAGDVNADGIGDFLIGAAGAQTNGEPSGECYVVFGSRTIGEQGRLDLAGLNGINGFVCMSGEGLALCGQTVTPLGDINGDGADDLAINALRRTNGSIMSGVINVVFGRPGLGSEGALLLDSLDGSDGFQFRPDREDDGNSGASIAPAGDVNSDGFDDLLVGLTSASPEGRNASGLCYLIYGSPTIGAAGLIGSQSLDGANGFIIQGVDPDDSSGFVGDRPGDFNGDGVSDILIGAPNADDNQEDAGQSYVLFGRRPPCPEDAVVNDLIDASDLAYVLSRFGTIGSPADINGDGVVDTADLGLILRAFGDSCP